MKTMNKYIIKINFTDEYTSEKIECDAENIEEIKNILHGKFRASNTSVTSHPNWIWLYNNMYNLEKIRSFNIYEKGEIK